MSLWLSGKGSSVNIASMIEWRLFTGLTVALFLLFSSGLCDLEKENDGQNTFASLPDAALSDQVQRQVQIHGMDTIPMPEHDYLNNIDWELRQPLDLSTATIITTANSTADRVHFIYSCGDSDEKKSTVIPAEGIVSDSVDWNCDNVLTTQMIAVGTDTTIEYSYQIDLAFLNTLDP